VVTLPFCLRQLALAAGFEPASPHGSSEVSVIYATGHDRYNLIALKMRSGNKHARSLENRTPPLRAHPLKYPRITPLTVLL